MKYSDQEPWIKKASQEKARYTKEMKVYLQISENKSSVANCPSEITTGLKQILKDVSLVEKNNKRKGSKIFNKNRSEVNDEECNSDDEGIGAYIYSSSQVAKKQRCNEILSSLNVPLGYAIPWGYKKNGISIDNTCPLDSWLMLLVLISEFGVLSKKVLANDMKLVATITLIKNNQSNDARDSWIRYVVDSVGQQEFQISKHRWNFWGDSCVCSRAYILF